MQNQTSVMAALTSPIGRKILTGITGILLVTFVIVHLLGNLQLLSTDSTPFNSYGHKLHSFGVLLYIVEVGLGLTFLLHAIIGVWIYLRKRKARKENYQVYRSKGGASKQTIASKRMLVTGLILLVFLVIHLLQFRFGPNTPSYQTDIQGETVYDLHKLVRETFSHIGWVIFYVGVMLLLGFHLRHGVWSALQSLGAMKQKWTKALFGLALVLGLLLAVGFLILPVVIYLRETGIL